MTPTADIRIIINPGSAAGRTGRNIPAIIRALLGGLPFSSKPFLTRGRGHAEQLAGAAVRKHQAMIVAVGGDGTINEVVNGMLSASGGQTPETLLGIIRSGSGSGLALSLGIPDDIDAQVRILREGAIRTIDAGFLEAGEQGGRAALRYFINECQVGIGADVVRRNSGATKAAGGLVGYGAATISSLFRTPNRPLLVTVDGTELEESTYLGLSIGNGALTGGGMALTPRADLSDGLLDLLVIRGQSLASRLMSFPRIYRGTHINSAHFIYRTARTVTVGGENHVAVAADGEQLGGTPCSVGILPGALRIVAPMAKE